MKLKDVAPKIVAGNQLKHITIRKDRRNRLPKVRQLHFVEHRTIREISEMLHFSQVTIQGDINLIRKLGQEIATHDIGLLSNITNFLWEMQLTYKARIKKLWDYERAETNYYIKMKIVSEVREQEKQYVRFLQESGLVKKKPDEHIHGIVYISHLDKKGIDKKNKEEEKDEKEMLNRQAAAVPL